jgi:hypothetical protein
LLLRLHCFTGHVIGAKWEPDERYWWEKIGSCRQLRAGKVMVVHIFPTLSQCPNFVHISLFMHLTAGKPQQL